MYALAYSCEEGEALTVTRTKRFAPSFPRHSALSGPLQICHFLTDQPKRLIQLDILLDAVDGAGLAAPDAAMFIADHALKPAFDRILLHAICHRQRGAVGSEVW